MIEKRIVIQELRLEFSEILLSDGSMFRLELLSLDVLGKGRGISTHLYLRPDEAAKLLCSMIGPMQKSGDPFFKVLIMFLYERFSPPMQLFSPFDRQ